jgi:Tol biopolymer transport system component
LNPSIDAAGTRIAFSSNADPLGSNGDGSYEIFLWDAATGFTQITSIDSPSILSPRINGAGTRIAFPADVDPLGSNGDGSVEIFLWDASTGLTQVTNTTSGISYVPAINAIGNRIAFSSNANPLGSNGDGNFEIFLWDASTGLTQITNTTGRDRFVPSINASGTRIAFQVNGILFEDTEIFLWDASTGLTQITDTVQGVSNQASINASGNRIAYSFSPVFLSGTDNIFLWDATAGFTQITNLNNRSSIAPAIDAAGNRIAFYSTAPLGNNGDGNDEVYLWDASTGVTQVTTTTKGENIFPAINAAGTRIAFQSNADLLGNNDDKFFQIFLASCQPLLAEVPAVSPVGLGVLAVLLGLAAAWTLRRRREPSPRRH